MNRIGEEIIYFIVESITTIMIVEIESFDIDGICIEWIRRKKRLEIEMRRDKITTSMNGFCKEYVFLS